jgi:hypothetical protein
MNEAMKNFDWGMKRLDLTLGINPCFETTLTMPVQSGLDAADMDPEAVKKIMNQIFLPFPEGTFVRWHQPYGGFSVVQVRECAGNGYVTVVHHQSGALMKVKGRDLHELSPLEKLALCAEE